MATVTRLKVGLLGAGYIMQAHAKALAPMGVMVGLTISTGAQRFSCFETGALTFFTMDANAGCVTAEYAANANTAHANAMAPTA